MGGRSEERGVGCKTANKGGSGGMMADEEEAKSAPINL